MKENLEAHVLLIGQAPISDFLQFMRTRVSEGQPIDRLSLSQEWREANERLGLLQKSESGFADITDLVPLSKSTEDFAQAEIDHPSLEQTLCLTPYRWALVELDRLVVFQHHINTAFVDIIDRQYSQSPTEHEVIRIIAARD